MSPHEPTPDPVPAHQQAQIDPVLVIQIAMDCIPNTLEGVMTKRRVVAALRDYFKLHEATLRAPSARAELEQVKRELVKSRFTFVEDTGLLVYIDQRLAALAAGEQTS